MWRGEENSTHKVANEQFTHRLSEVDFSSLQWYNANNMIRQASVNSNPRVGK